MQGARGFNVTGHKNDVERLLNLLDSFAKDPSRHVAKVELTNPAVLTENLLKKLLH